MGETQVNSLIDWFNSYDSQSTLFCINSSLQNLLNDINDRFEKIPNHENSYLEVLFMMLNFDYCNLIIFEQTIERIRINKIQINIVGFKSIVSFYQHLTEETCGSYYVATNQKDFYKSIQRFTKPIKFKKQTQIG